jgi:hypothetical protein
MPARRKTWLPSEPALSSAQVLAIGPNEPSPSIPLWALVASFTALLGRDNRKILPDRAARLIKLLLDFVLTIEQVEAKSIALTQAEKDRMVQLFTRDVLTIRPPAHPPHVLAIHSHLVDAFLQSKGWPVSTERQQQTYKMALKKHLPTLLLQLAKYQCNDKCPGRPSLDDSDVSDLSTTNSHAALRDEIVARYHCIAPDSLRGARLRRRFRRHLKK